MSDTESVTIADVAQIIDGPHATPTRLGAGPYFLNIASLEGGRLDLSKSDHVSDDAFRRWTKRVTPEPGDLLFSYETRLGEAALMPDGIRACLGRRMALLRFDREHVVPKFFLYYYISPAFRELITARTIQGATVPRIALSTMGAWPISLPNLTDQRAIAEVLGALDDKIAANRREQITIGRLFPALFRSMPGSDDYCVRLTDFVTVTKGVSYRSADLMESETCLVTLKSVSRDGRYEPQGLKSYVGPFKPAQEVHPGSLVVAQTDLTQAAEVIGRVVRVPNDPHQRRLVASLDLAVVRPAGGIPAEFVFGVLLDPQFREHCRARTSGTTVLHLASDAFASYLAPAVPPDAQMKFAEMVRPMLSRQDLLLNEMRTLSSLRDTLLPALMSGRLRVQDAEKSVEAVV